MHIPLQAIQTAFVSNIISQNELLKFGKCKIGIKASFFNTRDKFILKSPWNDRISIERYYKEISIILRFGIPDWTSDPSAYSLSIAGLIASCESCQTNSKFGNGEWRSSRAAQDRKWISSQG